MAPWNRHNGKDWHSLGSLRDVGLRLSESDADDAQRASNSSQVAPIDPRNDFDSATPGSFFDDLVIPLTTHAELRLVP